MATHRGRLVEGGRPCRHRLGSRGRLSGLDRAGRRICISGRSQPGNRQLGTDADTQTSCSRADRPRCRHRWFHERNATPLNPRPTQCPGARSHDPSCVLHCGSRGLEDAGQSALNRLRRDVLSQPGVRTGFLFEGVNDIKAHTGVTAQDLITGYREIAAQVHAAGKCVVVAEVGPFKGWSEWDPGAEAVREEVNSYLRGSDDFDAVTDFDRVLRGPYDPERVLPFFDGGDHLPPNDKGMAAMADAVDLEKLDCDDRR